MIPEPSCVFVQVNLGRTEMNDDSSARMPLSLPLSLPLNLLSSE